MSIQDWGAIGEIIGALAVVASLIYLAAQIRQNTRQIALSLESTRLAAFERNVESGNRMREILMTDPELAELFLRGIDEYRTLGSSERFRCDMLFSNLFSSIHGGYIRQQTIGGDPDEFRGTRRILDRLLQNAGIRQWLEDSAPDWRPEFVELVQTRIAAIEEQSGDPA